MKEDKIDRILSDILVGEYVSEEDIKLLEAWKKGGEKREWFANEMLELRASAGSLKSRNGAAAAFARVNKIVKKQRGRHLLFRWSVAASVAVALGAGLYFMFFSSLLRQPDVTLANLAPGTPKAELILPEGKVIQLDTFARDIFVADNQMKVSSSKSTLIYDAGEDVAVEYHTIRVPYGAEYNIQLSDSTRVYLNAGSSLRYPVRFAGNIREVFLTGEGYFEVTKNPAKAFVVRAGGIGVRVLGTSFNVNAYPEEKTVETTLVEGKVEVECGVGREMLEPGMQLVYDRENETSELREVEVELYTSWKDGYYYFKRESLEKIMGVLARWYNLNVSFLNTQLKTMEFGGRLKRYDDITYLLKKMEETQDVEFIINGNTIMIK